MRLQRLVTFETVDQSDEETWLAQSGQCLHFKSCYLNQTSYLSWVPRVVPLEKICHVEKFDHMTDFHVAMDVCNAGYMCRLAYMCMVTAFIEKSPRKMTMVMPRVHENITRIILAGTVSWGNSIYTSRASKLVLVDPFLKKCHSKIYTLYVWDQHRGSMPSCKHVSVDWTQIC